MNIILQLKQLISLHFTPSEAIPNNLLLLTSTVSTTGPNNINLLQLKQNGIKKVAQQQCQFPVTGLEGRIISNMNNSMPLILTASDALRVFCLQKINSTYKFEEMRKIVGNCRPSPIVSMSWNRNNPQLVAYSTFDTLVQIYDIETCKQLCSAQLHDKASNSIQFDINDENILYSGGSDGTLIEYDTRTQNKGINLFSAKAPILKVKQNPQEPNILAFIQYGSQDITVIDKRQTEKYMVKLERHQNQVTSIDWHPNNSSFLMSTSADQYCYIFDITKQKAILEYKAGDKCQSCQWGTNELSDWVSIVWSNQVEILKTGM